MAVESQTRFGIVVRCEGSDLVMVVRGRLDQVSTPMLDACMAAVVDAGGVDVVLDVTDLRAIDATGVGAIVRARRALRLQGRVLQVRVSEPPPGPSGQEGAPACRSRRPRRSAAGRRCPRRA